MKRKILTVVVLGLCVVLAMPLMGCGDDDGDGGATFKATVKDRMSRTPLGGKTCRAVDNDTGDPIAGFVATSEGNGSISFKDLPGTLVGFKCDGVTGEHVDTYQFNISTTALDEELWLVDLSTYQLAPALAGVTLDTTKGLVAGSVYWINASGEEEPVGCGQVTSDKGGEIRYFGANELPVKTVAEDPVDGRDGTHPNNGLFLVVNMEPGPATLGLEVEGQAKGSVGVVTFGADKTVLISNIYADETLTANPTPAGCE
jgi:hypothetical protein